MFLTTLRRRNPAFLQAVADLHRTGELPTNCLAIDLDAVAGNARAIRAEADRLGLELLAMTKQVGRNPDMSRVLVDAGITRAVAVDLQCAVAAARGGLEIGHLGHLVQVPTREADTAASLSPRLWTVYSEHQAALAGAAARRAGRTQDVLVRVVADGDVFYRGHEGGFPAEDVVAVADRLETLPGVRVAGVTTFPAALFDAAEGRVRPTPNLTTLQRAAGRLRAAGREDLVVNAPGTTSAGMLAVLAEVGATQAEPGHGLTGTTPWHAVEDLVEVPALAYVSEVSHRWHDDAYLIGGGLYVDPVLGDAPTEALLVPSSGAVPVDRVEPLAVEMPAPSAIDYYAIADVTARPEVAPGDTAIFGFRAQAFVTRALTAGIAGVSAGAPRVAGVWAGDGSAPLRPEAAR